MSLAGQKVGPLQWRLNGLRHCQRITLGDAANFVQDRLQCNWDNAVHIVCERAKAGEFPANIEEELAWSEPIKGTVDSRRSTVATADFLAWLETTFPNADSIESEVETAADAMPKPLGERERTTLLTIIAALAQEASIDITMPSKAASVIEKLTEKIGARVASRTIEDHLKRVSEALEKRATP